jgi:CPA2 family monovalent cation:H+ antiporter-2
MILFTTLLLVFFSALVGGVLAKKLRQPAIIGYIAVGVFVGNVLTKSIDKALIDQIASVGVTLLLFTLGVEFSFERLKKVLKTVSWAATLQILISFFVFLPLFLWFGYSFLPALFIAVACALSSTAVVVRMLTERGEKETIPGEVMTGWCVVQDLAVIPIMMLLPALTSIYLSGSSSIVTTVSITLINILKATIAIGGVIFLGRIGVPWIVQAVARFGSRELFLLTVIALVFLSGSIAYGVGLSAALGAFIAGIIVSETSQNHTIFSEIRPLRDIFAVVFFVSLGMALPIKLLVPILPILIIATFFILFGKMIIVYIISRFVRYHRKTAFLVAIGLAQMSEFGFIIAKEGYSIGALSEQQYTLLVALVFTTIMVSAPLASQGHGLYYLLREKTKRWFPKIFPDKKEELLFQTNPAMKDHVVICGYGRVGKYVGRALQMVNIPFIVVDYNETTTRELRRKGIPVLYGDPADIDVLDHAEVDFAKLFVVAIPDRHTQEMVIANAQTLNKHITILCRTHHEEDQIRLKTLHVAHIIQPEFEAAISITTKLFREYGVPEEEISGKLQRLKIEHGMG